MKRVAAFLASALLVAALARATPPPLWVPVPEPETPGGTLCVPRIFGPAGPCFSKPSGNWEWLQTEGGWHYWCRDRDTRAGFTVHGYADRTLSREAVAAEVRRTSFNPTGPKVRGLTVEPSSIPVAGSFRYTYALLGETGADTIVVGYVTPSGWIVSGDFRAGTETADFRAFLLTYRVPEATTTNVIR